MSDDYLSNTQTTGTVTVGGSVTGEIELGSDRDWFAVTLQAGKTYQIDLEGRDTDGGTLRDPYLRGIYDSNGNRISGTRDDNDGTRLNSRVAFTATEDGAYYVSVSVGAYSSAAGTYTLSVEELPDHYTAGIDTAGTVTVGGSVTSMIESGGDRDWFAVTLQAGKTYWIDLEGRDTDGGTLRNPYLRGIHDSNGDLIAGTKNNNGGEGRNSRVMFTATEDGAYYVSAGATSDREGTYTLSVEELPDDYTAGIDTAGTVTVDGGSVTSIIESGGDRDWFAVTLQAGKTYRIDLEGRDTDGGTLRNPYLRGIHDSNGDLIAGTKNNNGGEGRNSRVTFTATEDGAYYVSAGATRDREGTYTLSVKDLSDDYTAGIDTAGTVTVGGSVTGEVESGGDRDWFEVTLQAGRTYWIDLEGSRSGSGTLVDPYLRGIYDADGNLIPGAANDDDGHTDAQSLDYRAINRVAFTATEDGTYYMSAGAYSNHEGTYTLSVTDITERIEDDHTTWTDTDGTVTVGGVTVGGSVTGKIEFWGDRDWFAVELDADRTYRIDLEGRANRSGTLLDPYLRGIFDEDGNLIPGTTRDGGGWGTNSRVKFTTTEDGTYYVSAGAYSDREGTYTMTVKDVTDGIPDDYTAGTDTDGTVTVGGSVMGEVDYKGDHDWFAVTLQADMTYQIDLKGRLSGNGTLLDPYLRGIHDVNGDLIAGTTDDQGGDGNNNSRVTFTATEDATYYVSAGAFIGPWRDYVGTYTLSVEEVL